MDLSKLLSGLSLFPLYFKVRWQLFREEQAVKKRFYVHSSFRVCDAAFKKLYKGQNPYRISKHFLIQKGAYDIHVYGETPLTSLFQIAKESGLNANDHVIELGCGRGRGVFFLSHWFDCTVEGIEWIPEFVATANQVADCLNNPKVHFVCQDMLESDLANATIIYLCGTCLDDLTLRKLVKSLQRLARGTKIITVSFPITDYAPAGSFDLIKQFNVKFPWGETEVYLHKKI